MPASASLSSSAGRPSACGFLIEPLSIALPVGSFNGSCIVDPQLNPIEQHLIPQATAQRCLEILSDFGIDIWLFTSDLWLTRNEDGEYVPNERRAIRADPEIVGDFTPYLWPPARSSAPARTLHCCNAAKR